MGYLTDIARTASGYLSGTQDDYNRRRDEFDRIRFDKDRELRLAGELANRLHGDPAFRDKTQNIDLNMALDAITPRAPLTPTAPAVPDSVSLVPMTPAQEMPSQTPLEIPSIAGVSLRNAPWTTQNMGVVQDAERLKNRYAGGVAESQTRSTGGASPEQADRANAMWEEGIKKLNEADKGLAIKRARLAIMQDNAGQFLMSARNKDSADRYLKDMDNLQRSIDSADIQNSKDLIEAVKSTQRVSTSNKQSETQMARIEAAKQMKETARTTMTAYQAGQLSAKDAELALKYTNEAAKNEVNRVKTLSQILSSPSLNALAKGQLDQVFSAFGQSAQRLRQTIASQSSLTGGILSKDNKIVQRAMKDYTDAQNTMAESLETVVGFLPNDPETGAPPVIPGLSNISSFPFQRLYPGSDKMAPDWNIGGGLGAAASFVSSGGITVPDRSPDQPVATPQTVKTTKGSGKTLAERKKEKATSPAIGSKNAKGETWTGKRWLAPKK